MKILTKVRRALRGDVDTRAAALEAARRVRVIAEQRRERAQLEDLNQQPARLREEFARVRATDLLAHFRSRVRPKFLPGFDDLTTAGALQQQLFPGPTTGLINEARRIVSHRCWPLLGFGEKCFGVDQVRWNLDPLTGFEWPLGYHGEMAIIRNDGSDARVVWELNRMSHLITLGRAYAVTNDETFTHEFLSQIESWRTQNPVGLGINWTSPMEVALRAINLLGAFTLFLRAPQFDEFAVKELLKMLDQHGAYLRRNLEYSHIATSNHYLCDVTGLLWLGVMLPELEAATEWREFGLRELLAEMDKQILPDGADYEAATGYHRLKTELFLYSFVLCHLNGLDIPEAYWDKLRAMFEYIRAYLRPDGTAPLIGDSDNSRVLPIAKRLANDHAYLLALGAAVFRDSNLKLNGTGPEELVWILGKDGLSDYRSLRADRQPVSSEFPGAGTYVLRDQDLYLLFNASGVGINGRGSHGHNDALSIEVAAGGTAFIIDPGTYVYSADLRQRHLFRSTAYHSTVQVDGAEQNSIDEAAPFIIGNEAQPQVLKWETGPETDVISAEHRGYERLRPPVTHRRTVHFNKQQRYWIVEDGLLGAGQKEVVARFHAAPGLQTTIRSDGMVEVADLSKRARLLILSQTDTVEIEPRLEPQFSSSDYGAKEASTSICWRTTAALPLTLRFFLIPISKDEDEAERLRVSAATDP